MKWPAKPKELLTPAALHKRSKKRDVINIPCPNGNLAPVGPAPRAKRLGPALDDAEGHVSKDSPELYHELYGSAPAPEDLYTTNFTRQKKRIL